MLHCLYNILFNIYYFQIENKLAERGSVNISFQYEPEQIALHYLQYSKIYKIQYLFQKWRKSIKLKNSHLNCIFGSKQKNLTWKPMTEINFKTQIIFYIYLYQKYKYHLPICPFASAQCRADKFVSILETAHIYFATCNFNTSF